MPEAEVPGVPAAGASDSRILTLAHLGDSAASAAELRLWDVIKPHGPLAFRGRATGERIAQSVTIKEVAEG
ncbi:hypothetical protein Snoj_15450 [Streptomyces nojiriensis]|uniref:Uncharacterized protein n=1 Tax=Streptomyces nojiriensis TaxID=66374 RepID=A0ABQ3SHW3_9ACTN|nr:hypothetical protein JYK04_07125 [Streptomyces nojiriensis]GGS10261.1 hypothetical protein GCM10010205_44570 [Streptomyces nojiriensis]GHI67627.1 hypothetical protein Snoj_15450 [Streptomyces nojiriensis]